jgi:ribA/ribD-fused uncharacterized protein
MTMAIQGFFGKYRFLSNFWPAEVCLYGKPYPSVEHAYQAAKTFDPMERDMIRTAPSAKLAKHLGKTIEIRPDWDKVKDRYMTNLVRQKFSKEPLRQQLLDTYPEYLEETNTWGDIYWGVCNHKGQNKLGMILMQIRNELV